MSNEDIRDKAMRQLLASEHVKDVQDLTITHRKKGEVAVDAQAWVRIWIPVPEEGEDDDTQDR